MATKVPQLRVVVVGRIAHVSQRQSPRGTVFRTLVKTPAPDPYSQPGTFEVRSDRRIGSQGDEVSVECDLMGYARSYEAKDGATVRTSEVVLQAS